MATHPSFLSWRIPWNWTWWWATVIYTQSPQFTIFITLSVQYRNVKYIHTAVQQISGIFLSYKTRSLYTGNNSSLSSLPSGLGKHHSAVPMNLINFFGLTYVKSYSICLRVWLVLGPQEAGSLIPVLQTRKQVQSSSVICQDHAAGRFRDDQLPPSLVGQESKSHAPLSEADRSAFLGPWSSLVPATLTSSTSLFCFNLISHFGLKSIWSILHIPGTKKYSFTFS